MSEVGLSLTELDTPLLWVDLAKLESNIRSLGAWFRDAGTAWRPHMKGLKIPAIAHMALGAGAIGVTCASVREAEVMLDGGVADILVANQVVGRKKAARLAALCRRGDVKVVVDSAANVAELGVAARAAGVELGALVELNIGMNRAGIAPGEPALALSRLVHETAGLAYRGLMGWEGHVRDIEERAARDRATAEGIGVLTDTVQLCRDAGLPVSIVSAGGSGTHYVTGLQPGVTEIQAGGAVFCDVAYRRRWEVETEWSLFVRTTVTSRPAPDRIIFDAGFKTVPMWAAPPQPLGLPPCHVVSMSASHGVVALDAPDTSVKVGDLHDFVVGYGDSTVFLHERLYGVRNGTVEVVWDIPRTGQVPVA